MKTKTIVHKSAAPIYAAAVTWVLYALLFPLYHVGHFLLAAAAAAALDDSSYYENSKRVFTKERRRLEAFFKKQEIDFFPTEANFFLLPEHRLPIFELLSAAGITARKIEFAAQRYTRLSIGTAIENSRVMAALTKALACQPSRVKANI